ncbi:MAG: hypothetical protein EP346_05730 [Bacteroidetes bacterium]|nr:MAG: hypothetical protein EP346_05730 [Bacteroidota bacterium]
MKLQSYLIGIMALLSYSAQSQHFTLSGSYSPTLESYTFGAGFGGKDMLFDYQLGLSDEFIAMGLDMGFQVVDFSGNGHVSVLYLGLGGEMYLMDDYEADMGYSIYPSVSISYNQFVFTYGYGYLEYDGVLPGELEYFHKLKLTIIFADID